MKVKIQNGDKAEENKKKKCSCCGKKIGVFTESKIIEEEGDHKELCEECFKKWQKSKIEEMKLSPEGRTELYNIGSYLIRRGLLWTIGGIILNVLIIMFIAYSQVPFAVIFWGVVVFGFYDIFRGLYYKLRYRSKDEL